jgi:predicted methyltransferase
MKGWNRTAATLGLLSAAFAAAACGAAPAQAPVAAEEPLPVATATPPDAEVPPPEAAAIEVPARIQAIVDATDRLPEDKALDAGRHPGPTLAFFGIEPGMQVAELGAGGGYTADLLARAVGPTGTVWGHNTPLILERFAEKPWSARLALPVMKNVKRADREFEDPLPAEAKNLDAVFLVLFYHDLYWMKTDRAKMNAGVLRALKPGGVFAIVDHSAKAGAGATETQTLHRIEEKTLVEDVTKAGFVLDGSADFLRNPNDTRDWSASPGAAGEQRGTSDRFVLRFRKPL